VPVDLHAAIRDTSTMQSLATPSGFVRRTPARWSLTATKVLGACPTRILHLGDVTQSLWSLLRRREDSNLRESFTPPTA
jgi:hypothetical protein